MSKLNNTNKTLIKCEDKTCPIHGTLSLRGREFKGKVISNKMYKTATVTWNRRMFIRKYERYEKRRTKIKVHNPSCINATQGDYVKIKECRPISKTKHFTIIEKLEEK